MAWTATSFKARYPEFAPTPDAQVNGALADATARIDTRLLSTANYDAAVGLLTAHLLSITPFGQQARLEGEKEPSGGTGSTYNSELKRLLRLAGGGPWFAGQLP